MSAEAERLPWIKRYWPTMVMFAVFAMAVYDYYDRHHVDNSIWNDVSKLETISSRTFKNETVVLDGKFFAQPTFDHVTFVYNGTAPFMMDNATFVPAQPGQLASKITTRDHAISYTLQFQNMLFRAAGCQASFQIH